MVSPKPLPEPEQKPRATGLSAFYRQVMGSEAGARDVLRWLRTHPLYRALCEVEVVREYRWSHAIPADRYRVYLERYVAKMVESRELYRHPDWELLWSNPPALEQVQEWAERLGIAPLEARRLVTYIRDNPSTPIPSHQSLDALASEPASALGFSADMGEVIDGIAHFVRKYGMSEQMFSEYVLSGRWDARALAQQLRCPLHEAAHLLELVDRLTIAETVGTPVPSLPQGTDEPTVIAEVYFDAGGQMEFRLSSLLAERIVIDPVRLQEWRREYGDSPELRSVIEAIRAVNERATASVLIARTVCQYQQVYLRTDNPVYLRPLSQVELARELSYHRSVVSRIVRSTAVQTPHRRVALSELTPRLQQVLRFLLQAYPDWSNAQVASFLFYQHGLKISARTLAYHRRRIQKEAVNAGTA